MGRYEVMAESIVVHTAVVEADNEDDAVKKYNAHEWVSDLGDVFEEESVMSVMETTE